jgi:D-lactate dehydrogenase
MDNYKSFLKDIRCFIPKNRIYTDELRRLAWGTDASFYRLTPQIVVRSDNENEVSRLLSAAHKHNLPVTFRAAGTSLSGQAVSDSILIVAGKHWENYHLSDDHQTITLQPGIIGGQVNKILAPFGRKFGPDPASINSCMVGGIVTNNASGMSCGTHANSDKELISARIVFVDGSVLDTGSQESRNAFAVSHSAFIRDIESLRDEIMSDEKFVERIKYKYSIKNVTGLNIYPFVRFSDPFDIIAHLMVGSEGTLAFLSEVTMKTLPLPPFRASAMIYFSDIKEAARAVVALRSMPVSAAELLDKRSLASMEDKTGPDLTAVLTETQANTHEELQANISAICEALKPYDTYVPYHFTDKPEEYSKFWSIRSGIFPAVGGMRKLGTTCLIEDVAFHIDDLPDATADLSDLLDRHGYDDSCIYGHALEGNFHFIINQSFESQPEIDRYVSLIKDVVSMVVDKYDGSLKAEHGTGRNMAPFVKYEWGEKAYDLMKRVKKLFDPDGILNPGVIFNDDPECFVKSVKVMPLLSDSDSEEYQKINKCIECGFCEVNCLSCGFSLSARTRIVAQREMARLKGIVTAQYSNGGEIAAANVEGCKKRLQTLSSEYYYQGDKSCATDGLCSMSCPMGINVADLTHVVRHKNLYTHIVSMPLGVFAARHFVFVKSLVKFMLRLARVGQLILGTRAMAAVCRWLHNWFGIVLWTPSTPVGYRIGRRVRHSDPEPLKVVYLPSCMNQSMGLPLHSPVSKPLVEETCDLLRKAGYEVVFPENMNSLCCGTIWETKGMPELARKKCDEVEAALWKASEHGKYPILCDQSPCLHHLRKNIDSMKMYEPVEFIWEFLRDKLDFVKTDRPVPIHITCSSRLMHIDNIFVSLARLCSSNVIVPEGVGCCGFAGDKGMTFPELNAYALRKLRGQVKDCAVGYSNSRTCEIGLATNSGIPYVSIVYLVNECTRPLK